MTRQKGHTFRIWLSRRISQFAIPLWIIAVILSVSSPATTSQQAKTNLLAEAQSALDGNRLDEASRLLESILEIDKENHTARKALIDVNMRLMKWTDAQEEVKILRSALPMDPQAAYLAAAVAFRIGNFTDAVELSTEALNLQYPPQEALRIRALSRYVLQDFEGFTEDMQLLIRLDPQNPEPHYHLGRYYFEKQVFAQSEEEFRLAIEKAPRHHRSWYYLGWCQWAGGEVEKAKLSYEKSIEIILEGRISFGWPFSDYGELLITQGQFEEGLKWLYSGIRNDPDLPYTHFKYASALFKKDATIEVETELKKAIELDPGYAEAYYILANYYRKTGNRELAQEILKKFQELKKNPVASPFGVRRK